MTRQIESDLPVDDDTSHIANIGKLVEDMELKMRNLLQEVYFGKAKDVVGEAARPLFRGRDRKDGSNYANRAGPIRLHADFAARLWEAFSCAPLIVTGPELAAARALVGRFAATRSAA